MFEAQSDARNVRRLSNTYFDDLLSEAQIFKNREEKKYKLRTTDTYINSFKQKLLLN